MNQFYMNGYLWNVYFVDPYDYMLMDRTDILRVATTDPATNCVYLSNQLYGTFLNRVLIHELGHCTMFSFNMLPYIHHMVKPKYWVDMEEWICNFIADYGMMIYEVCYDILGEQAIYIIPEKIEQYMKKGGW